jgi:hypothetical protein
MQASLPEAIADTADFEGYRCPIVFGAGHGHFCNLFITDHTSCNECKSSPGPV